MKKTRLTKQERYWIEQYLNSTETCVEQAYGRPSDSKKSIEFTIKYQMINKFNGKDYRILSHNGWNFSCAFKVEDERGIYLIVFTPSHWYQSVPIKTVYETGAIKDWVYEYDNMNI
ncbi:MAG: hypothetical protein J6T10_00405 [Methanobrevibacter sp.]|nr:hypothetical protein [Methanobrevibacter sp.]